ncbi:DMT family transporter [Mycolicibacterium aromaticivorans]|uniref:DMT family transporter n=1 Tax=Mycolicibacterium aromaticivorans TaxID=318425 RepID=UPI0004B8741C|nr:DMT family transporter [Mycolicibacterium aromaticivorans]
MTARGWALFAAMSVIWRIGPRDIPAAPVSVDQSGRRRGVGAGPGVHPDGGRRGTAPHAYAAIAALAGICTALAFVVFFALIKEVGATSALLFAYVNPAVALIAGVLLPSEPLAWLRIAGLILILTGSVPASRTTSEHVADE